MSGEKEKLFTEYVEWAETQDPTRIMCIEAYGMIMLRLKADGHTMDSELMLDFISVPFSELTERLIAGMLVKITHKRTPPTDTTLN